jgi:hypothetical protein
LRPLVESFFAAVPADGTDMAALHAFRIRGKELRYGMELVGGAFGPDFREKLYPLVETLQDRLGALNDLATAQTRLRKRVEKADGRVEAGHLQKLLVEEQARFEDMHREFVDWFTPSLQQQLRAGFDSLLAGSVRPEQDLKKAFGSLAFPDPPRERGSAVEFFHRHSRGSKIGASHSGVRRLHPRLAVSDRLEHTVPLLAPTKGTDRKLY